jgi:hypothetical protein
VFSVSSFEYEGSTYVKVSDKACWVSLPEEIELTDDIFAVFKLSETMLLLKRAFWTGRRFRSLQALGKARLLKSKRNTIRFDKKTRDSVSWDDDWEVFIYSNFDDYILLACPPLDEMDYLEMRGVPGVISMPLEKEAAP